MTDRPLLPMSQPDLAKIQAFLHELFGYYTQNDCGDIDGGDFQQMLEHNCLAEEAKITEEECGEDWAQEWGYDPGDTFYRWTPLMQRLMTGPTPPKPQELGEHPIG
ncbi:MAG: hypothetical protein V3S55_03960 [Nitrospiraceae bacterium]